MNYFTFIEENEDNTHIEMNIVNVNMVEDKSFNCLLLQGEVCYASEETDFENSDSIGCFSLVIYDEKWSESIIEEVDDHSQDRYEAFTQLSYNGIHSENKVNVTGRIGLLNNFTIYKDFQNKGFGTKFMDELIKYLYKILCVDYILLMAHPYNDNLPYPNKNKTLTKKQIENNNIYINNAQENLIKFYSSFGFQRTGDSDLNYMVLFVKKYLESLKKEYRKKNIESALFMNIDNFILKPKEQDFWTHLFTAGYEVSGDFLEDGEFMDDYHRLHLLLEFHYAEEMLKKIKEWNNNTKDSLNIDVTPYFIYFVTGFMQQYMDEHEDRNCVSYTKPKCNICPTYNQYKKLFNDKFIQTSNSTEEIIYKYLAHLTEEEVDDLYKKYKKSYKQYTKN